MSCLELIVFSRIHHDVMVTNICLSGLTRHASLAARKPGLQLLQRLEMTWSPLAAIIMDEISLADPELIAVLNDSAGWGRMRTYGLSSFVQNTFGNTMLQVMLGDFLQLNLVKSHSLLGCFLQDTGIYIPGVPSYEHAEHAVKAAKPLQRAKKRQGHA